MHVRSMIPLLLTLALPVAACSSAPEDDAEGSEAAVSTRNETGKNFGLKDKEIVLTLDDGPGPRTVEVAEWFAREKVPVTFFMVGKNAKANPETVRKVAEISARNGNLLLIGNHSMTHTTPLPKQGTTGSINEIMNADAVLQDNIALAQQGMPSVRPFFRPPYGAFTALGAANIASVNAAGAAKYSGPVFWDIGGELSSTYSADWACWGKVSMDRCIDGYVAETQARGRGIILAHDVHSKTIDMLMGTGSANGRSLVKELRALGFKFVSLRAHDEAVASYAEEQQTLSASTAVSIEASIDTRDNGRVLASITTQGAAKIVAQFDNVTSAASEFRGSKTLDVTLAPGSHFLTVTAFDAAGAQAAQQRYSFVIAAEIAPDSIEATNDSGAVCVNFDLMKAGQLYRLYHGKVDCGAAGALNPPFIDECYKYKGVLKTTRDPKLVGPGEWSIDFDLGYSADPNDKSKVGFVMDAADGDIHTGKRYARGGTRSDVPMTLVSKDCAHGEWRGKFHYTNGQEEDFLFRMVRNPQTGGRIDYRE